MPELARGGMVDLGSQERGQGLRKAGPVQDKEAMPLLNVYLSQFFFMVIEKKITLFHCFLSTDRGEQS